MQQLHTEVFCDSRETKDPVEERKFDKASDFKIQQLVLIKNHTASTFQPKYLADHRVLKILNDSMVIISFPDRREEKCNMHCVKPYPTTAFTSAFEEFQKSVTKEVKNLIQQNQVVTT